MSPPTVRINSLVQPTAKPFVDSITKVYLIAELLFGVNRLPLITEKWIYIIPGLIYSGVSMCGIVYSVISYKYKYLLNFIIIINLSLYVVCIIFGFVFCKRMRHFYCELNKFDIEIGCRPKFTRGSIRNLIQTGIVIIFNLILFIVPSQERTNTKLIICLLPAHIVQTFEVHYYGHLLNLLTPRLRLINHYLHLSLTNSQDMNGSIINELIFHKNHDNGKNCQMKKITSLYYIIVKSYNYFIEAIKWQLLLIIISSFVSVLGFCYHLSLNIIRSSGESILDNLIFDLGLTLIIMIPLFAPCVFGDRVHNEVRRLRELLASRLYENKLDKSCRSIARTLLAFTETRDLSLTLLRILDIDISLPFKFVGLLVTYLIILLQFGKVLNP